MQEQECQKRAVVTRTAAARELWRKKMNGKDRDCEPEHKRMGGGSIKERGHSTPGDLCRGKGEPAKSGSFRKKKAAILSSFHSPEWWRTKMCDPNIKNPCMLTSCPTRPTPGVVRESQRLGGHEILGAMLAQRRRTNHSLFSQCSRSYHQLQDSGQPNGPSGVGIATCPE